MSLHATVKLVSEFLAEHGLPTKDEAEVLRYEGGYGKDWSANREQTLSDPTTGPGRWVLSKETDIGHYQDPDYLYTTAFCASKCSGPSYQRVGDACKNERVMDVGGSFFTARILLRRGVKEVLVVNFEGAQTDFIRWAAAKEQLPIRVVSEGESVDAIAFIEYLEHFREPLAEFERWTSFAPRRYYANSFCTPAYGHYSTLVFPDGQTATRSGTATRMFKASLRALGYTVTKIPGFNSKTHVVTREAP